MKKLVTDELKAIKHWVWGFWKARDIQTLVIWFGLCVKLVPPEATDSELDINADVDRLLKWLFVNTFCSKVHIFLSYF